MPVRPETQVPATSVVEAEEVVALEPEIREVVLIPGAGVQEE